LSTSLFTLDVWSWNFYSFLSGETSPYERSCVSVRRHASSNVVGSGVYGLNDSEFYLATSLYRSVDVSRLSLIRDLSERGVMCPLWDAIDTPCLIRGSITESAYLYDETKKRSLTKSTRAGLNGKHTLELLHL
jgi:hypothetical protein